MTTHRTGWTAYTCTSITRGRRIRDTYTQIRVQKNIDFLAVTITVGLANYNQHPTPWNDTEQG